MIIFWKLDIFGEKKTCWECFSKQMGVDIILLHNIDGSHSHLSICCLNIFLLNLLNKLRYFFLELLFVSLVVFTHPREKLIILLNFGI